MEKDDRGEGRDRMTSEGGAEGRGGKNGTERAGIGEESRVKIIQARNCEGKEGEEHGSIEAGREMERVLKGKGSVGQR